MREARALDEESAHKLYTGRVVDIIPQMMSTNGVLLERIVQQNGTRTYVASSDNKARYSPMTPRQLLKERLHGDEQLRTLLRNNFLMTACLVMRNPEKEEAVIGLYSDEVVGSIIDSLNPLSSLKVDKDMYHEVKKKGLVLEESVLSQLRRSAYALPGKRREIWDFISEGNKDLISQTEDIVLGDWNKKMGFLMHYNATFSLLSISPIGRHGCYDCNSAAVARQISGHTVKMLGVAEKATEQSSVLLSSSDEK